MKKIFEKIKLFQDKFAIILSDSLSSMTMFWIIALLVIVPLFFSQPVGIVGWMQYIVSVFFQGVALPVLGYISKISGIRTDKIINKIAGLSEKIELLSEKIHNDVDDIKEEVNDIKDDVEENDSDKK